MAGDRHRDDTLPWLDTFSKAAELGSFTSAAGDLGITQAAVSQRVQALEKKLGVSLFQRQGGRASLTPEGRKLYSYAQKILDLHREARRETAGDEAPVTGELTLAASSIPGEHLLPGIMAVFRKQYPGIQVRARQTDSLDVLREVERGTAQLGLVGRKSDGPTLEFEPFAADELVLVAPADHRWKRRKSVSLRQFREEPLIVRETGSGSRWCLEQALAGRRLSLADLNVALELGGNEAIKEAVLQGMGVAVLSLLAVRKELESGQLRRWTIDELTLDRTMFVAWDHRRALPAAARIFRRFLHRCPSS